MFVSTVSVSAKAHNLSQMFYNTNIGADLLSFWLLVQTVEEEVMEGFSLVPVASKFSEFLARDAFVRTNCRAIAMTFIRQTDGRTSWQYRDDSFVCLSICDGGAL